MKKQGWLALTLLFTVSLSVVSFAWADSPAGRSVSACNTVRLPQGGLLPVAYAEDGRSLAACSAQWEPETAVAVSASYTILFTDAAGLPIAGVFAQICDDTTCTVLFSDESGTMSFSGENHSYELHVLTAPEGYAAPDAVVLLSACGGSISVTLEAAEPQP